MSTLLAPILDAPPLARYGYPQLLVGTSPVAGTNFTYTFAGGFYTRLLTVSCRIVTDGNAANRTVRLEYLDDAGNIFAVAGNPVTYPASSTEDFFFDVWQGQGEWEVNAANLVPLKPIIMPATFGFRIAVASIQATDALSRIRFMVEQFYAHGQPPGPEALS